jgi:hypothetical protein
MSTFKEYQAEVLKEMALVGKGDWSKNHAVSYIVKSIFDSKYEFVDEIKIPKLNKTLKLYKSLFDSEYITYRFGDWVDTEKGVEFGSIASMTLEKCDDTLGYKNIWKSNSELVAEVFQMKGIAKELFHYFVKELKITLLGDSVQYFGSRKLWSSISKSSHVIVDIIDITHKKLIDENVEVYHGFDNWDWDKRVWTDNGDDTKIVDIRLILRDIK